MEHDAAHSKCVLHPHQEPDRDPGWAAAGALFSIEYPRSLNFGAMGVVMGHELSHAFDDQVGCIVANAASHVFDNSLPRDANTTPTAS